MENKEAKIDLTKMMSEFKEYKKLQSLLATHFSTLFAAGVVKYYSTLTDLKKELDGIFDKMETLRPSFIEISKMMDDDQDDEA